MIVQDQSAIFIRRLKALLDQNLSEVIMEGDSVEFDLTLNAPLGFLVVVQRYIKEFDIALLHLSENAFDRRVGLEGAIDCIALWNEDSVDLNIVGMPKDDDNVEFWSIHIDALGLEELFQRRLYDGRIVGVV